MYHTQSVKEKLLQLELTGLNQEQLTVLFASSPLPTCRSVF